MPLFKFRPRGGGCPGKGRLGGLGQLGFVQAQSLLLAWGTGRCAVPVGRGQVAMGFWEGAWVAGGGVSSPWCGLGAGGAGRWWLMVAPMQLARSCGTRLPWRVKGQHSP